MPPARPAPNLKRGLLGFLLLESMLAGLWICLVPVDPSNVECQSRVGEAIGVAMGGLLGVFAVPFVIAGRHRTQPWPTN